MAIIYLAIAAWIVLGGMFLAYPTIRRLKAHRDELGLIIKVPVYLWLAVGLLADVVFNATWGTAIFRELPREFLFTTRLKRHRDNPRAQKWIQLVNLIDPNHV